MCISVCSIRDELIMTTLLTILGIVRSPPIGLLLPLPMCPSMPQITELFFFSSIRRHTRFKCDWSSDVCSSDLIKALKSEPGALWKCDLQHLSLSGRVEILTRMESHCAPSPTAAEGKRSSTPGARELRPFEAAT